MHIFGFATTVLPDFASYKLLMFLPVIIVIPLLTSLICAQTGVNDRRMAEFDPYGVTQAYTHQSVISMSLFRSSNAAFSFS